MTIKWLFQQIGILSYQDYSFVSFENADYNINYKFLIREFY